MSPFSSIQELFDAFHHLKVVVVGDVMVDAYLWGRVDRISPEAPVPIVAVHKRESRLGGAANVAINIQAMGARPYLCSVIGDDRSGEELLRMMKELGMPAEGMLQSSGRVTTVKTRVIGNNHQLLRVDDEVIDELSLREQEELLRKLTSLLDAEKPDVLIFEDYDKGVLNESLIEKMVTACRDRNIPTAVDPKKKNFNAYKRVSLFKPNLAELKAGLKIDIDKSDVKQLRQVTRAFQQEQQIDTLMVTLSEAGVYYSHGNDYAILPAHVRNISDVSGAGDTVISVASLCLALKLKASTLSALANLAGGLVCEKVGVVPIDKIQLQQEASSLSL
ncbi:MAG: D-glycero-beta-D-manno-heptose-7-phosphate kinase [Bacteroidia bacterium]|nr:D-glycero-beta-D-manno-heptose-7-phosphate kinase [Bacteroidia bacterium]